MARPISISSSFHLQLITNKCMLTIVALFSMSILMVLLMRDKDSVSCDERLLYGGKESSSNSSMEPPNPLSFMRSKLVLLVSHELSLTGGPLLLMEFAYLLRSVNAEVVWITYQQAAESYAVLSSLENKLLAKGVQILDEKGHKAINTALEADLIVLNTAVSGRWLDDVLQDNVPRVLSKTLWWIHEMRGNYFKLEYLKHLPSVAAAMIDSHTTAEYWQTRTKELLGIKMPDTFVVHLGNSKEFMEVAESSVAIRVLREHVRERLGVQEYDLLFAIINSVSRRKGQDLFLRAFHESLQIIKEQRWRVPPMHAVIVGSDMNAETKFETELRSFVAEKKIQNRVHFINKTLTVAPYLAAIDILVQNSQARGECFGRITIEAMAFSRPVLGTAAGGTMEIVANDTTGLLHPTGKEGITPLAKNIVELSTNFLKRFDMGREGYHRVKERFLAHHMAEQIANVLKEVFKEQWLMTEVR